MTHKNIKNMNFHVLKCVCSLLRAEGFFCNLDVLYVGLRIGILHFLIQKKLNFFSSCNSLIMLYQYQSKQNVTKTGQTEQRKAYLTK
jgi:hypothetical protein